jgi:acetoin:2,6-dichlorophenolindophenol oxidoreductase subunit beta
LSSQSYISQIIGRINLVTENCGSVLLFGENIDTGSCIGGLARGLKVNPSGSIQNVGNCELTHCGVGLGMLLDGGQSVLFVKQLDFMLLGLDQICNTFNYIRAFRPRNTWGSFTIFTIVCDQGFQGPQSSLNAAGDFASLANIPVYCLNAVEDASQVVRSHFVNPGFRMICLSQRLFGADALEAALEWSADDGSAFRYRSGDHATVISFNFSLRDALDMDNKLRLQQIESDVFHINYIPNMDLKPIIDSFRRTGKLIIVDDSKTVTKFSDAIVIELTSVIESFKLLQFNRRGCDDYGANDDRFFLDFDKVLAFFR